MQKAYNIRLANVEKLRFFAKTAVVTKDYATVNEVEITSRIVARSDYQAFCESLDVFSLADFVRAAGGV